MPIYRAPPIASHEITDEALFLDRRRFLQGAAGAAAGLALSGCFAADEVSASAAPPAPARLGEVAKGPAEFQTDESPTSYADATTYNNFYEFGTGKTDPSSRAGSLRPKPWSVAIEGEVVRPGSVPLEELLRGHALEERIYRLRCVEAWSMVIPWVGIPLAERCSRASSRRVEGEVRRVRRPSLDPEQMPGQRRAVLDWPYVEGLRIDEAMHPLSDCWRSACTAATLPNQNGAPLRLVVPWKYGFKSIKSIVKIRLQETQPQTTWSQENAREYGFYANVNPEVSHPRWSQARERRIGDVLKRPTLYLNGYADEVGSLYRGMDPARLF